MISQESSNFTFLNQDHLSSHSDPQKYNVEDELLSLFRVKPRIDRPQDLIEERALLEIENDYQKLCHSICAFQKLFSMKHKDSIEKGKKSLASFLSTRSLEDWCLFYLEVYFWRSQKGRITFLTIIKKKLFQEDVHVLYSPRVYLFRSDRDFGTSPAQTHLEGLFKNLKMNQGSCRKDAESFKKLLFSYKTVLNERACFWMVNKLDEESNWFLKWYIFDRALFANDLLELFEESSGNSIRDMGVEDQKILADFIFVVVLIALVKGELRKWSDLEKIDLYGETCKIHHSREL